MCEPYHQWRYNTPSKKNAGSRSRELWQNLRLLQYMDNVGSRHIPCIPVNVAQCQKHLWMFTPHFFFVWRLLSVQNVFFYYELNEVSQTEIGIKLEDVGSCLFQKRKWSSLPLYLENSSGSCQHFTLFIPLCYILLNKSVNHDQ